jgi:hypothetical protein
VGGGAQGGPYGFIDPSVLGYRRALWHAVLLCLAFLVVAALLRAGGRAGAGPQRASRVHLVGGQ